MTRLPDFDGYSRLNADSRLALSGAYGLAMEATAFEDNGTGVEVLKQHLHGRAIELIRQFGKEEELQLGGCMTVYQYIFAKGAKQVKLAHEQVVEMPSIDGGYYQARVRLVTEPKNVGEGNQYRPDPDDVVYLVFTPLELREGYDGTVLTFGLGEFNDSNGWLQFGQYAPVSGMDMGDCLMLGELFDKIGVFAPEN